jgi:hypothetical protein
MKEATLKDKYRQVVVQSKRSERRTTEPLGVIDQDRYINTSPSRSS